MKSKARKGEGVSDTSFLCSLYRRQIHTPRAITLISTLTGPLPVSTFLLFELLHAQDRAKGFTKVEGEGMLRDLQSDLNARVLEIVPVDWAAVHLLGETTLSAKHTEAHGNRLADILHVATALHLGVTEFLTFDGVQKKLAQAEGLTVLCSRFTHSARAPAIGNPQICPATLAARWPKCVARMERRFL